ncbi:MAG: hypothetical protein RIM99_10250 [Cyclobacteriaceae bacterium]
MKDKTPSISIEEALKLYLATAVPGGLPDEIDPELLLERLRIYIASERPDWANSFPASQISGEEIRKSYSKIKQEIIEKALREEIPEDPEEQYLYERRKEALRNLSEKKAEEREEDNRNHQVKKLINKKSEAKIQNVEEIKNALQAKLREAFHLQQKSKAKLKLPPQKLPKQENQSNKDKGLNLSDDIKTEFSQPASRRWEPVKWTPDSSLLNRKVFKDMELSENQKDKLVALETFHEMRKQNLYKRSDVVKPLSFEKIGSKRVKKRRGTDEMISFSHEQKMNDFSLRYSTVSDKNQKRQNEDNRARSGFKNSSKEEDLFNIDSEKKKKNDFHLKNESQSGSQDKVVFSSTEQSAKVLRNTGLPFSKSQKTVSQHPVEKNQVDNLFRSERTPQPEKQSKRMENTMNETGMNMNLSFSKTKRNEGLMIE